MASFTDGINVSVGDAILASHTNSLADNTEFNREASDQDHDFAISTGTGDHKCRIGEPMHMQVDATTVWTVGWWEDAAGAWWLLVNTADVASFARGDADFYIPTNGAIGDVPAA
jgi:hypothetical protein